MMLHFSKKYLFAAVIALILGIVITTSVMTVARRNVAGDLLASSASSDASVAMPTDDASVPNILPAWLELVDVPTYPLSRVDFIASSQGSNNTQLDTLILTTPDKAADVVAYYKRELPSRKWTMSAPIAAGLATVVSATKGNRSVSVLVMSGEEKTDVTLELVTSSR